MSGQLYSSQRDTGEMCLAPQYDEEQAMCVAPDMVGNADRAATVPGADSEGAVREAAEDLGTVDSLSTAGASCGAVIDALVPNNGDKAQVQLNLNIPIHPSGSVLFAFQLVGQCERDDAGAIKLRSELQLGVMGQIEIETWLVDFELFLRAAGLGYVESVGGSGAEAFRFIALAVRQQIADHNEDIADMILDGRTADGWTRQMGDGEYAELGMGLDVSAGVALSGGGSDGPDATAQGGYRYLSGERVTNGDGDGRLETHDTSQHEFRGAVTIHGTPETAVQGKVTAASLDDQLSKVEGEIQGDVAFDASELSAALVGSDWLSGVVEALGRIISQGRSAFSDEPARLAGQLADLVTDISPSDLALSNVAAGALDRLSSFNGINVGHMITAKASWEQGRGLSWELVLERTGRIEFGDNPRDRVYMLLENIDRVFRLP